MKAYLNYFKIRVINNLQYRAAALAGISTQLFFGIVYIMLYLALYESNLDVETPMNLQNLITYMWLQQAFFAVIYPFLADNELLNMIKNGNIAYELIRPQDFYFKFYIKMLANRMVAVALRCLPIIIIGLLLPYPYKLGLPLNINCFIIFIVSLFFSCLLTTSLSLLIHIFTIYTLDSRGLTSAYSVLAEVFMGLIIPLPFLPMWLQNIAYVLPFRFMGDFPFRVYSGDISEIEGINLLLGSLFWVIVSIMIGYLITRNVLKKAVIQGG